MNQELLPSGNNFHFDANRNMQHGLGADEPSLKLKAATAAADAERAAKEEALKSAERSLQEEARQLEERVSLAAKLEDERQSEFERRMAELDAREKAATEREAAAQRALEEATKPSVGGEKK